MSSDPQRPALSRRQLAERLGVSRDTIRRREEFLGLDCARVQVSATTVRYSERRLRTLAWYRLLDD
jgi:transcriptional regulator with XRE-family HTH domain